MLIFYFPFVPNILCKWKWYKNCIFQLYPVTQFVHHIMNFIEFIWFQSLVFGRLKLLDAAFLSKFSNPLRIWNSIPLRNFLQDLPFIYSILYCAFVLLRLIWCVLFYCFLPWLTEPYDYPSWCFILVFSVHATGAAIFIYEWLSPRGLNRGTTPLRGNGEVNLAVKVEHTQFLLSYLCSDSFVRTPLLN